jgi:hypothetical protein
MVAWSAVRVVGHFTPSRAHLILEPPRKAGRDHTDWGYLSQYSVRLQ